MRLPPGWSAVSFVLLLPAGLFGKCPIAANGTLELRAPVGNVFVETNGVDSVEVAVSGKQLAVQENCEPARVSVTGTVADQTEGIPDWKISVPRTVTLDLATQAGMIQVGDTEGAETILRTSSGKVVAGNIKGDALIVATEVRTGNIGGDAEIRGQGGKLLVGDVGGDAQFVTTGGDITTGIVRGSVSADTGSGSVSIRQSNGDVTVSTQEGDITSDRIRGSFDGRTDSGNIRIESIGSWVHAFTGLGDIFFRLVPENLTGDLHVKAESAVGNITMYIPQKLKATFDVVVDNPAFNAKRIISDFGLKAPANAAISPLRNLFGPERQNGSINGGGNTINVHTSSGTIRILKGN